MKIVKFIAVFLCVLFALLIVLVPYISSCMQSHYKAQLDDDLKDPQMLLDKKRDWVRIGESPVFFYGLLCSVFSCSFVFLIDWLSGRKKRIKK